MRLESLRLKGMLRFRDELHIDCREIPSGLVALTGENGAGKTTVLEIALATLYRRFPSRDTHELVDYAQDRDSYLEAEFAIDGRGLFRARVNLDGVRRQSDAILERIDPDGTRTILTDGKVTTYDRYVRDHFPPVELVRASVFAAQNRFGAFSTLNHQGKKALFSALLGLDHYDQMADTARTAVGLVEKTRTRLVGQRDFLAREVSAEAVAKARRTLEDLRRGLTDATAAVDARAADVARIRDELAALQEAAQAKGDAVKRLGAIEEAIASCARTCQDADQAIGAARATADTERGTLDADTTRQQTELDERLANNRTLLAKREAIEQAQAALATATAELEKLQVGQSTLQQVLDESTADLVTARDAFREAEQTRSALARARRDSQLLGTVPCGGGEDVASCQFLRDARQAVGQVEALAQTDQNYDVRRQAKEDLQNHVRVLQAAQGENRDALDQVRTQIAQLQRDSAQADHVQIAAARIDELTQQRQALRSQATQSRADIEARRDATVATRTDRKVDATVQRDQLEQERTDLQQDVAAYQEASDQAALKANDLRELTEQLQEVSITQSAMATRLDTGETALVAFEQKLAELEQLTAGVGQADQELVEWQFLAKAFGRTGLPVLEIDAAGPTVASYCNDLLATCYGPRFTIDLVTQEAKVSKGKGDTGFKESFAIKVFDNERGGDTRDLSDLSGGEQVIVNEGLMNALALYANERLPMPIRTCWRDETTGALDGENVMRYVAMLRRVQELGGFENIFFVTHSHHGPKRCQQPCGSISRRNRPARMPQERRSSPRTTHSMGSLPGCGRRSIGRRFTSSMPWSRYRKC